MIKSRPLPSVWINVVFHPDRGVKHGDNGYGLYVQEFLDIQLDPAVYFCPLTSLF